MTTINNPEQYQHAHAAGTLIMLGQSPSDNTSAGSSNEPRTVETRFGKIDVDPAKAIHFERGLLGIPDRFRFVLVNFPGEKMHQFMLLQSLDEDALSFITLPCPIDNTLIASGDIEAASTELQISGEDLAVLTIVSVHRMPNEVKLSVNVRAPLFIDAEAKTGVQYVFHNDRYQIQQML